MKASELTIALCVFLLSALLCIGCQKNKPGSKSKDAAVIEDLFNKGNALINKSFDSAWYYAVKLSEYHSQRAQFLSDKLKTMFFFSKEESDSAIFYAYKNKAYVEKLGDKKEKAGLLNRMGAIYNHMGNYDSALLYLPKSIELYREIGDIKHVGATISNLASTYMNKENYSKAIELYDSSIIISEKIADTSLLVTSLTMIGVVYQKLTDYQKAMDYIEQSLYFAKAFKSQRKIAVSLEHLGIVNNDWGKEDQALVFFLESKRIFAKLGDSIDCANLKLDIADVYAKKGENSKAFANYRECIKTLENSGKKDLEAEALSGIGVCLSVEKKLDQAEPYLLKSIALWKKTENQEGISNSYKALATIYLEKKDFSKSEEFLRQSIEIAAKKGYKLILVDDYQNLSEVYEKEGMFEKSLQYNKLFKDYSDSVFNEKSNKQLLATNIRFETTKKQAEIEKLNQERQVQKQRLHFQYILILAIAFICITIAFIAILLLRQRKLKHENQLSATRQKMLRSQMNPHFIFNALSAIQSYTYENEPAKVAVFIGNFAVLMRSILEGSINDFIPLSSEIEIVKNYLSIQQLRFDRSFEYKIEIDPAVNTENLLIPPMLTQPFLENAIEHGLKKLQKDGQIKISYLLEKDMLKIALRDNGTGFDLLKDKSGKHVSRAVEITRERLAIMKKEMKKKLTFSIKDIKENKETGVLVEFSIPVVYIFE